MSKYKRILNITVNNVGTLLLNKDISYLPTLLFANALSPRYYVRLSTINTIEKAYISKIVVEVIEDDY